MGETTCKWIYLSLFHILATLSLKEQEEPEDGGGREMCLHVPSLLTEVHTSEGWRESKRRAKSGEKTSLSGM